MENIRDIIVNDVRFALAEISNCCSFFESNEFCAFSVFLWLTRVRLLFSTFFFSLLSHTRQTWVWEASEMRIKNTFCRGHIAVVVDDVANASQRLMLFACVFCIKEWRRRRRRIQYNHLLHTNAHTCVRVFFFFLFFLFVLVNESRVSLTCTWMIEEHWPYYRKEEKLRATEPSASRMRAREKWCVRINWNWCTFSLSRRRRRSAALIQNNNMDYENIAVDGNGDGRKMAFLWHRCQRAQHCGVSLMNENGIFFAIRTPSGGCHKHEQSASASSQHRIRTVLAANVQSHARIECSDEIAFAYQNRCRSNDELLQISFFRNCLSSCWARRGWTESLSWPRQSHMELKRMPKLEKTHVNWNGDSFRRYIPILHSHNRHTIRNEFAV